MQTKNLKTNSLLDPAALKQSKSDVSNELNKASLKEKGEFAKLLADSSSGDESDILELLLKKVNGKSKSDLQESTGLEKTKKKVLDNSNLAEKEVEEKSTDFNSKNIIKNQKTELVDISMKKSSKDLLASLIQKNNIQVEQVTKKKNSNISFEEGHGKEKLPVDQNILSQIELKSPKLLNNKSKNYEDAAIEKQFGEDFINNKNLSKKNTSLNIHKDHVILNNNDQVTVKKMGKNIKQYAAESAAISKNIIDFPSKSLKTKESSQKALKADLQEVLSSKMSEDVSIMSPIVLETSSNNSSEVDIQKGEKVLDLDSFSNVKTDKLIQKIGTYIEQSYIQNKGEVELVVNHKELGQFTINASKVGPGQQVELEILAHTKQGQQFFQEFEVDLVKTLNQSGVKLSQLKIVAHSSGSLDAGLMNSDQKGNQQQGSMDFSGQQRGQHSHGQNQHQQDSQRRRQLWQDMKEQYAS